MAIGTGAAMLGASLLSGVMGARNASSANRAAEAASRPQPYSRDEERNPWGPTVAPLQDMVGMARDLYERNSRAPGPPMRGAGGIRGASPRLRELANAMRERAMGSSFIPDMQDRLSNFMEGPNPMMQQVFDRSMNYKNPLLDMLTQQGQAGPGSFDTGSSQLQGFLTNLLGGQQQLGATPPGAAPMPTPMPAPPPAAPPFQQFQPPTPGPQAMPMPSGPPPGMAVPPPTGPQPAFPPPLPPGPGARL